MEQEQPKKKVFIKNGTLFSPISSGHLRLDVVIGVGGMQM